MYANNGKGKWAIIGGSRGLGRAILNQLAARFPEDHILCCSRKEPISLPPQVEYFLADVAKDSSVEALLERLNEYQPQRVICAVGGGPYGEFAVKKWSDHMWALNVSLLFPMQLGHWACTSNFVQQLVVIGSSVAESQADPRASSYAAAKHGIKGWISSVRSEEANKLDLRLFSPGYMDTSLVPPGAEVREKSLWSPEVVAGLLLDWATDAKGAWHHQLARFPCES